MIFENGDVILNLFFIWAPCAAIAGYLFDGLLSPLNVYIVTLLMLIMLCMGLTLKPSDFFNVTKYKGAISAGMALQFTIMPLTALLIATIFGLNQDITMGLVLVGSVAGGTSSNVMTYIAGGNVALSVSMTALSTLFSVIMTPLLLTLLVGSKVDIPATAILVSLLKIILLPIGVGVMINTFFDQVIYKFRPVFAPLSVLTILIIIAIVVAINKDNLSSVGIAVVVATLLHNISGLALGYLAAFALGFDRVVCRTLAIEVGMQNSGLATALALKFFSPLAALPGAIFSIWLNITGSIFASICLRFDSRVNNDSTQKRAALTSCSK